MDYTRNFPNPDDEENLPCKVCGVVAYGSTYGVPTCMECKAFFNLYRKRPFVGECANQKRCFIGGSKHGYWNEFSKCKACRYERMVYLGLWELQKMRGLPRSSITMPSNVAGPSTTPSVQKGPIPREFVAPSPTAYVKIAPKPSTSTSNIPPRSNFNCPTHSSPNKPSTSRASFAVKRCRICDGENKVAMAYGAQMICITCSQFFFRSWKDVNRQPVHCTTNQGKIGNCNTSRTNSYICRFCRLKKSLDFGMKCNFPLTKGSAVHEVITIMNRQRERPSNVVDAPSYDDSEPLFSAKPEVVEPEGAEEPVEVKVPVMMSPRYTPAPPPPTPFMMSPARTDVDIHMNTPPPMPSTSSAHTSFAPLLPYTVESLCPVCLTYPIFYQSRFCAPCKMFYGYACSSFGEYKSSCTLNDCNLQGDPSKCHLCRLLRCIRLGMTVLPQAIMKGSPLHRAMFQAKNTPLPWLWIGCKQPIQRLPKYLEEETELPPSYSFEEEMQRCAIGKKYNDHLVEAGHGIQVCKKCKEFFIKCIMERTCETTCAQAVCQKGGKCNTPCLTTPCIPCKLIRCLEVGMCAPWKQGTLFYFIVKAWRPKVVPLDVYMPKVCACGRIMEITATGDTCMECTSKSLISMVKDRVANGEERHETFYERLHRVGHAGGPERTGKTPTKERRSLDGDRSNGTGPSQSHTVLPSGEIIPIEIIRVGVAQEQTTPVANGHRSPAIPPAPPLPPLPQKLKNDVENGHSRSKSVEPPNEISRKRKSAMSRKSSAGPSAITCQVCTIEFTQKQQHYDCTACNSCAAFFHKCFTEEEHCFCRRKKGDNPCNIQQTPWQHKGVKLCNWCRLVKWISLSPRLPTVPVKGSPIHQMVYQEQVAVLTDEDEERRGSYRLEPIEDNLKLSASRTFQLVKSFADRTDLVSGDEEEDEGSAGSVVSGSSRENRENRRSTTPGAVLSKNNEEKESCVVCGNVRRSPDKKLGGRPACSKCIIFINGCWTNVNGTVRCNIPNGVHGKCELSWKYSQCVYCQMMRAISTGCVPREKPVRGSVGEMMVEEHRRKMEANGAAGNEPDEDVVKNMHASPPKRPRHSEGCVGCGNENNVQTHYGVKMCSSCYNFFRNCMKASAMFIPCKCQNNTIGKCAVFASNEMRNCCGYCRLKKLISSGMSLCKENIEYTPVKMMIDIESIPVNYVSGGSYATKSSMKQVPTQTCQVCAHFKAASHFHGVFLCKKCRHFITKRWSNHHALFCLNPQDQSKCRSLVAQQCGLCRMIKCIEVGARSNGPPEANSFIAKLCPGYPEKRKIDERVLRDVIGISHRRMATTSPTTEVDRLKAQGELPPLIDEIKMEAESPAPENVEENGMENGELEDEIGTLTIEEEETDANKENIEENEKTDNGVRENQEPAEEVPEENDEEEEDVVVEGDYEDDDEFVLDHYFDDEKTLNDKCWDFMSCFEEMLVQKEKSNWKEGIEEMDQLTGWNLFLAGLEPFFEAFCKWADTLKWMTLFDDDNREQILRDSCIEAVVLVTSQMMRKSGLIPYGTDDVVRFSDLQKVLQEKKCTDETTALNKFLECFNLMEEIDFVRRDLAMMLNIILVKRTGYGPYILNEYFKELESVLISQSLEDTAPMEKVRKCVDAVLDTGDLIRYAFLKLSRLPFTFPPLVKRFLCYED